MKSRAKRSDLGSYYQKQQYIRPCINHKNLAHGIKSNCSIRSKQAISMPAIPTRGPRGPLGDF